MIPFYNEIITVSPFGKDQSYSIPTDESINGVKIIVRGNIECYLNSKIGGLLISQQNFPAMNGIYDIEGQLLQLLRAPLILYFSVGAPSPANSITIFIKRYIYAKLQN